MTHDTFQLPDVCHATQQRIYRRRPSRQHYHRSQPTSPDPLTSRSTCNPKVVPGRALTALLAGQKSAWVWLQTAGEGREQKGKATMRVGDAQSPAGAALHQLLQPTQPACVLPAPSLLLELGCCNSVPSAPQASRSK